MAGFVLKSDKGKTMKAATLRASFAEEALDTTAVASITLAYDLTKGLGQFGCGFLGDRMGRKPFIVGGLGALEQSAPV